MSLPPYISLITLGVADVASSTAFYERLGFSRNGKFSNSDVTFIQLANTVLGIWSRASLADDARLPDTGKGFSGVALAINVTSEAAADAAMKTAEAAGATILKPAEKTFWGGYAGYFADPDGHIFEVAHNPFFPLDETGRPNLAG